MSSKVDETDCYCIFIDFLSQNVTFFSTIFDNNYVCFWFGTALKNLNIDMAYFLTKLPDLRFIGLEIWQIFGGALGARQKLPNLKPKI